MCEASGAAEGTVNATRTRSNSQFATYNSFDTASLVERLHAAEASQVVSALASSAIATTEAAMGECLSKASQLLATIESTNWEIFDAIAKLVDERQSIAQSIRSSIAQAMQSDEHVTALGPTLKELSSKPYDYSRRRLNPSRLSCHRLSLQHLERPRWRCRA